MNDVIFVLAILFAMPLVWLLFESVGLLLRIPELFEEKPTPAEKAAEVARVERDVASFDALQEQMVQDEHARWAAENREQRMSYLSDEERETLESMEAELAAAPPRKSQADLAAEIEAVRRNMARGHEDAPG